MSYCYNCYMVNNNNNRRSWTNRNSKKPADNSAGKRDNISAVLSQFVPSTILCYSSKGIGRELATEWFINILALLVRPYIYYFFNFLKKVYCQYILTYEKGPKLDFPSNITV